MNKYKVILGYSALQLCVMIDGGNGALLEGPPADQPLEKFSNYYQKPMRNLAIELMDEVLEYAHAGIKDVIETINNPNKKESIRMLLVGEPGVGKTTLAQAIAMQTNHLCFMIRAPSLANQYQFSGEQNLIAAISPLFAINEPDDKTMKRLIKKTVGFSARDLKTMVIKGKMSAHKSNSNGSGRASNTIISDHIWHAYNEQKSLIASGWHVKERIKELFDNHGVALGTCTVSTVLTMVGIMVNERRTAQSMAKSDEQFAYQKNEKRKAKRDKLLKEIFSTIN